MNENQRKVLIVAGAIVLVMLAFPPFHFTNHAGVSWSMGYSFIGSPPILSGGNAANVHLAMLGVQWAAVLIAAGIAFFVLKDKP